MTKQVRSKKTRPSYPKGFLVNPFEVTIKERQRTQPHGNIPALAKSISANGQINSITVIKDGDEYILIAGLARLFACQLLSPDREEPFLIRAELWEDLDEVQRYEIELEEDVQRTDRHWADRAIAEKNLFELKCKKYGDAYTQDDYAQEIGTNQATVSLNLQVAGLLENIPDLRLLSSRNEAIKSLKQASIELLQQEKARRYDERGPEDPSNVMLPGDTTDVEIVSAGEPPVHIPAADAWVEEMKRVTCGDTQDTIKRFKDLTLDLIVTDTPFGIELVNQKKVQEASMANMDALLYGEDTQEAYFSLMENVVPQFFRILKEDSHLWIFFGIEHYKFLMQLLEKVGFKVDKIPYIWYKTHCAGQTNAPEFYGGRVYETFLFARKGSLQLARQGAPNVLAYDTITPQEKIHITEKPETLMHDILSRSGGAGTRIYDPFYGAGATLTAAKRLKMEYYGNDREPFYQEITCRRLAAIE